MSLLFYLFIGKNGFYDFIIVFLDFIGLFDGCFPKSF